MRRQLQCRASAGDEPRKATESEFIRQRAAVSTESFLQGQESKRLYDGLFGQQLDIPLGVRPNTR